VARHSNAGEHIRFEIPPPFRILDFEKRPHFKDPEVVHQNVELLHSGEELLCALFRCQVCRYAFDLATNLGDGFFDALLRASVDIYESTFTRQQLGNRESDPRR